MSPHPARILIFIAVLLAWLLTAKAASADEPVHVVELDSTEYPHDERYAGQGDWHLVEVFVPHEPVPRRARARLTLSAFSEWLQSGSQEAGAFVVLDLPLDRLAMPVRAVASLEDEMDEEALEDDSLPYLESLPTVAAPTARACVSAALRAHGLENDERLGALATRARASAALPDLRLRAVRATDASLRLSPTQYDPYRYTEGEEAGYRLEATLGFRLGRLLFADEEVALERIRLQRVEARQKLVTRVLRALFAWQTAAARQRDPALSLEQAAAATLRVLEAEAELEVLTAGACRPQTSSFGEGRAAPSEKRAVF